MFHHILSIIALCSILNNVSSQLDNDCPPGTSPVPFNKCLPTSENGTKQKPEINLRDGVLDESLLNTCCDQQSIVQNSRPTPPATECGVRNRDGIEFRVTNTRNDEAQYGEFPWQLAILRRIPNSNDMYLGGGSLIHRYVALTAAHIFGKKLDASRLIVRAGEYDTQLTNEPIEHQNRAVSEIRLHPDFAGDTAYNDVALLLLARPVDLTATINTICLPTPRMPKIRAGSQCVSSGWGTRNFANPALRAAILKSVEMPVVSNRECERKLRQTDLTERFDLHASFMCAGGSRGSDMCTGDGGSPLACPMPGGEGDRYYLAGVVSWGKGCNKGNPGVYADVGVLRNWIEEQMSEWLDG